MKLWQYSKASGLSCCLQCKMKSSQQRPCRWKTLSFTPFFATRVAPVDLRECKPNLDGSTPRPCRSILLLSWYFLGVDINCCHSHTNKTQVPFIIYRGRIRNCRHVPPPSYINVSPGGDDTCSTLEIQHEQILMRFWVERNKFCQRLVVCAEGPFTTVCIITECSDISTENSASVWIFVSLLTSSQSRLKSDGTRNFAHSGKQPTYRSQAV